MNTPKISAGQLFALIILFVFGTAIAVNYGLDAKKDAWIAILLGTFSGCLLFMLFSYLYRQYPDLTLTCYTQRIMGKYVGWLLGMIFVLYFIYDAARDVRDAGELLNTSVYDATPIFVLNAVMLLAIAYVLDKGLYVLARLSEIFIVIIAASGIVGSILVFASRIIDLNNLLPVLEYGWKPILTTTYPSTFIFPFGEMLCFSMLFPLLKNPELQLKTGLLAIVLSGLALSYTIAIDIAVLGADISSRSIFALLTMVSKVNIADFLQRLDPIALFTMLIVDFFKIAMLYYAAVIGTADLFQVKPSRKLVVPVGCVILITSMSITGSFNEHLLEGKLSISNFQLMVVVGIPLLLAAVHLIRKYIGKGQSVDP
ncbi:spore germination protein [Paenibacillus oenotherae]|uniref:Spore germination protein n=1 Tax=Paenibacillus oenotherae TaxID=1435645 RepID=A0ABS7D4H7_9BACL|nr:GerAB/ArcD/ProY family transporter [Paenibacillus oenotherae]MBW7474098.1 spore germination protein [Paenibacillus oenotherae]